jgi:hypothetical protein
MESKGSLRVIKRIVAAMLGGVLFTLSVVAQTGGCSLQVADMGSFVKLGTAYKVRVISKKTEPSCLVSYAAQLTRESPGMHFEFYDAQSRDLNIYMSWNTAVSGAMARGEEYFSDNIQRLAAQKSYSDKWVHKHHIATLWAGSDVDLKTPIDKDGCQPWVLISEDNKTLATFDHICPAR